MAALAFVLQPIAVEAKTSAIGPTDDEFETVAIFVVFALALIVYLLPAIIGFWRHHPNRWLIALISIVFGGTVLGWFGSLIWALSAVHKSDTGSDGGESGLNIFANDPVHVQVDKDRASSVQQNDAAERLVQLKRLLDQGAISQEEYEALRKPVIGTLREGL